MSELLNVAEVAAILKVSPDTVVRRFANLKGVLNLGSEGTRHKRRYRLLRIPKAVVEKVVGHTVTVPVIAPKSRRRAKTDWMVEAYRNLAKIVNDNSDDPRRRELYKRISDNARMLVFVPEEDWQDVEMDLWLDVEGEENPYERNRF